MNLHVISILCINSIIVTSVDAVYRTVMCSLGTCAFQAWRQKSRAWEESLIKMLNMTSLYSYTIQL